MRKEQKEKSKEQERLEVNIYAIETHLNSLLAEKQELLGDIKLGYTVRNNYRIDISTDQSNNQEKKVKLEGVNEDIIYLNGKLNEINKELNIAQEQYDEAKTEYVEYLQKVQKGSGIKRKIVKRKVIPVKPTVSKPAKPTARKPTKPTAHKPAKPTKPTTRKPVKPTKPTTRKPTIVRRK
jgi:TolA-binding protein